MKLYFGTPGWGWTLWGVGYKSAWFFGFSKKREQQDIVDYQFCDKARDSEVQSDSITRCVMQGYTQGYKPSRTGSSPGRRLIGERQWERN